MDEGSNGKQSINHHYPINKSNNVPLPNDLRVSPASRSIGG